MAMKPLIIPEKTRAAFARDLDRSIKAIEEVKALFLTLEPCVQRINDLTVRELTALKRRVEALEQQREKRAPARATRPVRKEG